MLQNSNTMLQINNLTKIYGKSEIKAVDSLNLEVKKGEIFGFIGPNGAGKSTTIKCVTGILGFEKGEININGFDLKKDNISAKRSIGYVSDSHIIYEKLTGLEYVTFMASVYGMTDNALVKQRLEKYLEVFNLKDAINNSIKSYSHGMKQKINVIGAIIHNPALLILDEPLTGLDPQSAYELKEIMREHCSEGNTVFFSSHVLDVVEKVCSRVGIIDKGQLIAVGTVDELKNRKDDSSLESFFLSITSRQADVEIVSQGLAK
ncbi:MAG: ABC transporter ATP-binding protein [Clostridia bacterium]